MRHIERIGPQNPGDGPLLRRLRLHQSWYRAEVLKLADWGAIPGANPRELGSVLTVSDAATGLNFVTSATFGLFKTRHAEGWGVDPRCTAYMTSSQTLTINLIGLLDQDPTWFADCLNQWLGRRDLHRVLRSDVEFAPARRSLHLNDQTRIDVLVTAVGDTGTEVIALEVKYGDRFNSRRVNIDTPSYRDLGEARGLWTEPAQALTNPRVNQLARVHALATSHARSVGITRPASVVVVAHDSDRFARDLVGEYAACVASDAIRLTSLTDVCASLRAEAPLRHRSAVDFLTLRYGNEDGSSTVRKALAESSGDRVA